MRKVTISILTGVIGGLLVFSVQNLFGKVSDYWSWVLILSLSMFSFIAAWWLQCSLEKGDLKGGVEIGTGIDSDGSVKIDQVDVTHQTNSKVHIGTGIGAAKDVTLSNINVGRDKENHRP